MSIDLGWFVFFAIFTIAYIVLDFFDTLRRERWYKNKIEDLQKEVKSWGDCCYTFGYNDGLRARKAKLQSEEKENADQTV